MKLITVLTNMKSEIEKAIEFLSKGDEEGCIKHTDEVFKLYKKFSELYTKKIREDLNNYLKDVRD